MSSQRIVNTLKKIRRNLKFFHIVGEISEESLWAFAPNQGIVPPLIAPKSFWLQLINSDRVVLPTLFFQGFILLLDAALLYLIIVCDKEADSIKHKLLKAVHSTLACAAIAGIATLIIFPQIKVLIAIYVIQSAIDIFFAGIKLGTAIKEYVSQPTTHETYAQPTIHLIQKNKNVNNIVAATRNVLFVSLFLTLTGLSFVPVPLISNIAQVGLVCITVYHLGAAIWSRYNKYKKQKIHHENVNNIDNTISSTQRVLKHLKPDLAASNDNIYHENQATLPCAHAQETNDEIWQRTRSRRKKLQAEINVFHASNLSKKMM